MPAGGMLIGAGLANNINFHIFAGIALAGGLVTYFVPRPVTEATSTRSSGAPSPTTVDA